MIKRELVKPRMDSLWQTTLKDIVFTSARPVYAIVLAFVVSAIMIVASKVNPITAYVALFQGAFGSLAGLANTCVRATPLLFGGLGIAYGFKAGLLNIGAEGQMYAGGAAATVVALTPLPVPAVLHVTLAVSAGFAGGLIWGFIPGYLRAYRGVSEIVVTLMLNYVGIYFINWLVEEPHPLAELNTTFPQSPIIEKSAQLPILIKGTSMHAGIILGVVLGLILYLLLRYTPSGFKTRMIGQNPEAARYAGVRVEKQILFAMLISAGFGGLAGASEVLGLKLRLFDFFAGGVGYEAIAVALLANGNPLGVIFSAFFFGALKAGANKMQIVSGIESSMALIVLALAVLFVIAIGFGERRLRSKRKKDKDSTERGIRAYGD